MTTLAFGAPAFAQDGALKAREAAASARQAASDAQRELDAARRSLKDAQARVAERAKAVEELEVEATAAETSAEPSLEEVMEAAQKADRRAQRAERRAAAAERQAHDALARVEELEQRFAYDRTGLYLGGSLFYAPEAFDEGSGVSVKSSRGASGRIGYRVHSNVALDLRFDYLDGFDVFDSVARGEVDGWAITGNVRGILLPGRWQPWLGLGIGVIRTDFDAKFNTGGKVDTKGVETDSIVRVATGFDTYLTPNIVLTVEAAINAVAGDRDYIDYGQLGVGLDYRF